MALAISLVYLSILAGVALLGSMGVLGTYLLIRVSRSFQSVLA